MLPVFNSPEDYQAARVMAGILGYKDVFTHTRIFCIVCPGLTDTPTWVGLRIKDNTINCNSPTACEAQEIFWHIPDETVTVMTADALFMRFIAEDWFTGPIDLDSSGNELCATMNFADDSAGDNHVLQSYACNQGRPFACAATCTMRNRIYTSFFNTFKPQHSVLY